MVIRVVVADDQALIRAGLRLVVAAEDDIEVVGEAADGLELLAVVDRTRPDVALVDIRMPHLDGLAAAVRLGRDHPGVRVVALTTFDDEGTVREALDLGVHGFVLKVSPPERLVAAIRTAAAGDVLVDPVVTRHLLDAAAGRHEAASVGGLTDREVDVLRLLARGLSNAEIAARLVVGETTVKTHVARLLAKLGLRDRLQAAVWAHDHGIGRADRSAQ
ncbi:MAG: response regulator [Pseudonocardia sp.]